MGFYIKCMRNALQSFLSKIFNVNIYPLLTDFLFLLIKRYVNKKDDENENNKSKMVLIVVNHIGIRRWCCNGFYEVSGQEKRSRNCHG